MAMEISTLRRQLLRHATPARRLESAVSAVSAVILPFPQPTPKAESPWERYPCTRMHGAAFEAEFHQESDGV